MTIQKFINKANKLGELETPFLFLIDFELKKPVIYTQEELLNNNIRFSIKNSAPIDINKSKSLTFSKNSISKEIYEDAFSKVISALKFGDTYLLNLTFPTPIECNYSLEEIYNYTKANYKLKTNNFVLFSPECFIKIENNNIYSYPMKGTIDAKIPNAKEKLLSNKKEIWEHNTIVDLIRNDLSRVSKNIKVTKFRFIDIIKTHNSEILQASSEIRGDLNKNWQNNIGDILIKLLPAGSISGAPKIRTCEIISDVEQDKRGYFTGIFGYFDGENLDSGVNIRYIEKIKNKLFYRSGGGITYNSELTEEYNEMLNKVYVPII